MPKVTLPGGLSHSHRLEVFSLPPFEETAAPSKGRVIIGQKDHRKPATWRTCTSVDDALTGKVTRGLVHIEHLLLSPQV